MCPPAGIPVADVFLQQPLQLGYPNTLVCMVGNIFPPAITISWQRDGVPITDGVTQLTYIPMEDLSFMRFSYLEVTPHSGDIYSCIVTRERDNMSVVAYWGEWGRGAMLCVPAAVADWGVGSGSNALCPRSAAGSHPFGHVGHGGVRCGDGAGRPAGTTGFGAAAVRPPA